MTLVNRWGVILTLFLPSTAGSVANAVLTVLWVLGITNGMNFIDGWMVWPLASESSPRGAWDFSRS